MKIIEKTMPKVSSLSLNITSLCNLKCYWCYNQSQHGTGLEVNKFNRFFENIIKDHISCVTLIGGEPTVHPDFFGFLEILKNKHTHVVTNGLKFAEQSFFEKALQYKMVNYSVSLKGYTLESFLKTAKVQEFDVLLKAIHNMKTACIYPTYTYVLQEDMEIHEYTLLCDFLHQNDIQTLIISDVRPYFSEDMEICKIKVPKHMEDIYEYLIDNGINAYFRLNHPLCHYSLKFIERLIQEEHLIMQCAVKRGGGLFFSESLDLVLCNGLQSIVVGSFDKNFLTYNDMINYLIDTKEMMDKLTGYPTKECESCDLWTKCGGCCLLYWL